MRSWQDSETKPEVMTKCILEEREEMITQPTSGQPGYPPGAHALGPLVVMLVNEMTPTYGLWLKGYGGWRLWPSFRVTAG